MANIKDQVQLKQRTFLKKMWQRCQSLDQFFSDIAIFRQQVPASCLNIGMIFEFFYIPLRPANWVIPLVDA
jgi:hypothetical protein